MVPVPVQELRSQIEDDGNTGGKAFSSEDQQVPDVFSSSRFGATRPGNWLLYPHKLPRCQSCHHLHHPCLLPRRSCRDLPKDRGRMLDQLGQEGLSCLTRSRVNSWGKFSIVPLEKYPFRRVNNTTNSSGAPKPAAKAVISGKPHNSKLLSLEFQQRKIYMPELWTTASWIIPKGNWSLLQVLRSRIEDDGNTEAKRDPNPSLLQNFDHSRTVEFPRVGLTIPSRFNHPKLVYLPELVHCAEPIYCELVHRAKLVDCPELVDPPKPI
ncbi:hypothetical protein F511_32986 [Dorcoceras hygrometricum]|uniref:Uncharacterized protein n=1 Tax=Dorcoceras hygrometricum TaxID=472368 RepID=A0A2Z7B1H2_9LAMI|nr:hypothetical protein F511_32986 [Dorcoceras hygrometricum]